MIFQPSVRKKSLCSLRDQIGHKPPPVETCHLLPGPGNGRTYNSSVPDSSEEYASQWPSGENAGCPSQNDVRRNRSAFPRRGWSRSPSTGAVQISDWPRAICCCVYASRLPSGEKEHGTWKVLPSVAVSRCASPTPSARIQ